jgi:hypothetical protein
MDILKEILKEIQNGQIEFKPVSQSLTDIQDFQSIAKALSFANEEGLLEEYIPHKNTDDEKFLYDLIIIPSGLSYKGNQYLLNQNTNNTAQNNEIIILKPSLFGVGIDLKAIWNRWKNN